MFRIILSIGIGVALGGTAVFATNDRAPVLTHSPKTSVTSCPAIVQNSVATLALPSVLNQPTEIRTLERAIAHGSEFEKERALFELAGTADSPTLQKLIFDTRHKGKTDDRHKAQLIFFERLTELDPLSALALAQPNTNVRDKTVLQRVWQRWAIDDLDSALQKAAHLTNAFDREFAAQSMLSAYGFMGNDATRKISAATGIVPNAENRVNYYYRLADKSATAAFEHVNDMKSAHKQREAINQFGHYFVQLDGNRAARYANLLTYPRHQYQYLAVVAGKIADVDPQSAMTALSSVASMEQRHKLQERIIGQVVRRDVQLAKQLADQIVDSRTRDFAYYTIIQHHVRNKPVEAAGWVSLITDQEVRQYAEQLVERASRTYSE